MNERIDYVITRMAAERGITSSEMQSIIEEAIHAGAASSDSVLRREMLSGFEGKKPLAVKFIEEIAKMVDAAHHDE